MEILALGMMLGLVAVAVPGPVSVSLVQIASLQGRAMGVRAAAGIVGGDVILAVVAIAIVSIGASMPGRFFEAVQALTAAILVVIGVVLFIRPVAVQERIGTVSRPLRAFLLLTALMPTALGSWLAMLSAMPFANDRPALVAFAVGIVLVSAIWHSLLGMSAGVVGPRLTPGALRLGTKAGGVLTALVGLWALLAA